MNFPTAQWHSRIALARQSVRNDAHFDLSLIHVMRILSLFGPHLDIDYQYPKFWVWEKENPEAVAGWQRRSWNSILCAEKVVHLCKPLGLKTDFEGILKEAKQSVLAKDPHRIQKVRGQYRLKDSDNLFHEYDERNESKVITQAISAYIDIEHTLMVVSFDVDAIFESNKTDYDEIRGDPWTIPTCRYVAYGLGGVHQNPNPRFIDNEARKEFWLWWLDKSLLASWNLEDL